MFRCFRETRGLLVLLGADLLAAYLIAGHGQQVGADLPVLALLACPLMHLLMHAGHGGQSHHRPAAHPRSRAWADGRADTLEDPR